MSTIVLIELINSSNNLPVTCPKATGASFRFLMFSPDINLALPPMPANLSAGILANTSLATFDIRPCQCKPNESIKVFLILGSLAGSNPCLLTFGFLGFTVGEVKFSKNKVFTFAPVATSLAIADDLACLLAAFSILTDLSDEYLSFRALFSGRDKILCHLSSLKPAMLGLGPNNS